MSRNKVVLLLEVFRLDLNRKMLSVVKETKYYGIYSYARQSMRVCDSD